MTADHRAASPADSHDLHRQIGGRLARRDHRYTGGRRRLVEALVAAGRPMTLPDIVASAPDIAQSSAYRNLDVLEQCGIIRRITAVGDHTHFELAESLLGHHHHLVCIACGRIEDIQLDDDLEATVDNGLATAAERAGFRPLHHSLDLHGHCRDCRTGR